jgi:predicted NAD/FAD-binding protein
VRLNEAVKAVVRRERGAELVTEEGTYNFDKVILACHADEALEILAQPSKTELELLTPFKYENNYILVHTDETVMPQTQRAWASWNYRVERHESAAGEAGDYRPTTHYWMNNLQRLSGPDNYFVSLNSEHLVRPEKILRRLKYSHPLFDLGTFKAQPNLSRLNEGGDVYFCGSYFRYGFHEDALASAYELCEKLLRQPVVL